MRRPGLVALFLENESGASAIEYGVILALLFVGILGVSRDLRTAIVDLYMNIVQQYVSAK